MTRLVQVLMDRDDLSREEAEREAVEVAAAVLDAIIRGEDPEEVFAGMTGLEPDCIEELPDF